MSVLNISLLTIMGFCVAACETQPAGPGVTSKSGCCYSYQDYRWGDYPWEGKHSNPAEVWDDYRRNFGTNWQGQEGEMPQAGK